MPDPSRIAPLLETWQAIGQHHQSLADLYAQAERLTTGNEDSAKAQEQAAIARSAAIIAGALGEQMTSSIGMN